MKILYICFRQEVVRDSEICLDDNTRKEIEWLHDFLSKHFSLGEIFFICATDFTIDNGFYSFLPLTMITLKH